MFKVIVSVILSMGLLSGNLWANEQGQELSLIKQEFQEQNQNGSEDAERFGSNIKNDFKLGGKIGMGFGAILALQAVYRDSSFFLNDSNPYLMLPALTFVYISKYALTCGLIGGISSGTASIIYNKLFNAKKSDINVDPRLDLHSSEIWHHLLILAYEQSIADPDGWNRKDFDNDWNKEISLKEFAERSWVSSIRFKNKGRFNRPKIRKELLEYFNCNESQLNRIIIDFKGNLDNLYSDLRIEKTL